MKYYSDIQVTIDYKLINSDRWESVEISPDVYFELDPGEEIELNSIPRYNHAIQYLNLAPKTILITKLTLVDKLRNNERLIVETFWNNGENRVIERIDRDSHPYWEMILESKISNSPPLWEILRLGRQDGCLTRLYHGFIQESNDGSQTETLIS
jgi:hypothetical protein